MITTLNIDSIKNNSIGLEKFSEDIQKSFEKIDKLENKVFIGTQAEYEIAYNSDKISVGALVIILDDSETSSETTAMLGKAVIGTLLLGKV